MPDDDSEDWLPPGWTVKVRVRDNGKKDKECQITSGLDILEAVKGLHVDYSSRHCIYQYYFSPSGGPKFDSRIKVSRHLSSIKTSHLETNVVFEKSVVADLPAGSFKTITTAKNDPGDRRDTNVAKKPKFAVTRARRQIIFCQSSNLQEAKSDKTTDKPAREEECMLNTEFSILNMPKAEDAPEIEAKTTGSIVSMSEVGMPTDNKFSDGTMRDENGKIQKGKRKCKQNKETNLPRRTSKRLAAIGGDYLLTEPKTNMALQGTASKCSEDTKSITSKNVCRNNLTRTVIQQLDSCDSKSETKFNFNIVESKLESPESMNGKEKSTTVPELCADKRVGDSGRSVCQGISLLQEEKPITTEELDRNAEQRNTAEVKSEYSCLLPLTEILSDPCIAFAVQTLTGVKLEAPTKSSKCCEPNNYTHPPAASTVNCYGNKTTGGEGDVKQEHDVRLQGNLVFAKGHIGILDKGNENLGSSQELPSLSWLDPRYAELLGIEQSRPLK